VSTIGKEGKGTFGSTPNTPPTSSKKGTVAFRSYVYHRIMDRVVEMLKHAITNLVTWMRQDGKKEEKVDLVLKTICGLPKKF